MSISEISESPSSTQSLESPDYVQMSLAAAMVLGAEPGRFYRDVKLGCMNLLLTYERGCFANCAYCGLARERSLEGDAKSFIRVTWPTLALDEVVQRMVDHSQDVGRVCISMVSHPRAYADTLEVMRRVRARVSAPISLLIAPNLVSTQQLEEFRELGGDRIGIGLDAASEVVFERTRGRNVQGPLAWNQYWQTLTEARRIFGPHKVNAHIVVGIGETDGDLVTVFSRLNTMEVDPYLFCFYPEADSRMARRRRPGLQRYRQIQLVKYLLEQNLITPEHVTYDARDRIAGIDVPAAVIEGAVANGEPFRTNGCPGADGQTVCTRPFGSYRPGEPFRDYPMELTAADIATVRKELRLNLSRLS